MNNLVTVTFTRDEWLASTRDGQDYSLNYTVVNSESIGKPDEASHTTNARIILGISGSLAGQWNLNTEELRKVLFEFGKRHVKGMIADGTLADQTELQFTTYNAPDRCPFDPNLIILDFGLPFEISAPAGNIISMSEPSSLAFQIIDLRDSINAVFGEQLNGRLLTLPQERHLMEMFKECNGPEEFAYRVASLASLATAIDPKSVKTPSKKQQDEEKELKQLDLLGMFMRQRYSVSEEEVNDVMNILQNFNHLRRMYPIHSDRATGVLKAHQFFGLDYPVSNYKDSWKILQQRYRDALDTLLQILKSSIKHDIS